MGIVFAACTVWPWYGLAWLSLVSSHVVEEDPHAEENVERRWADRARSGAFLDVLGASGVGLAVLSVTGLEASAVSALLAVTILAMAHFAVRYALLSRRES